MPLAMAPPKSRRFPVSIAEKVAFLRGPQAYPARPRRVDVVETHMSWVFLAGEFVYKLRKPVRHAFLDFSTLAARRLDCRREVRLNRRLAPDVYRSIIPLVQRRDGCLGLDQSGRVVDWLVEMRHLPADRMLDALIRTGSLTRADVESLARILTTFYRRAQRHGAKTLYAVCAAGRFCRQPRPRISHQRRHRLGPLGRAGAPRSPLHRAAQEPPATA